MSRPPGVDATLRIGPVTIGLVGLDLLTGRSGRRIASMLVPLGTDDAGSPEIVYRIRESVQVRPRASNSGYATDGERAWAVDDSGNAAVLPFGGSADEVTIDAHMDPGHLLSHVHLPVVQLLLRRHGWALLRGSGAVVQGTRVIATGAAWSGKTHLLVEGLRRGGQLVGDGWVAFGPDGRTAPVHTRLHLRPVHGVPLDDEPVRLRRLAARAARIGDRVGDRAGGARGAWLLGLGASIARDLSGASVGLHDAFPSAVPAPEGRLDTFVVLGTAHDELDAPAAARAAVANAAEARSGIGRMDDALRRLLPGRQPLAPPGHDDGAVVGSGLAGTTILCAPPVDGADTAATVMARALEGPGR